MKYPHDDFPKQVMLSPAMKISGHNQCCQHPSTGVFFMLVPNVLGNDMPSFTLIFSPSVFSDLLAKTPDHMVVK